MISPTIPASDFEMCLEFDYSVLGKHPATVRVLDQDGTTLWEHIGHFNTAQGGKNETESSFTLRRANIVFFSGSRNEQLEEWLHAVVTLPRNTQVFVLEASRGGYEEAHTDGDVGVDNLEVEMKTLHW